MAKAYICIRDFKMLKAGIAILRVPKNKLSMKLLLNLDEKNAIITPNAKNNNKILPLGPKKMPLPNNLILINIPVPHKKPQS